MLKFLFYILIIWLLVRAVSHLFLPSAKQRQRQRQRSNLFQIFSQIQNQMNNGSGPSSNHSGKQANSGGNRNKNLDDIEEADFEDVTDEEETKTSSSSS